jgi:hypothetical protein
VTSGHGAEAGAGLPPAATGEAGDSFGCGTDGDVAGDPAGGGDPVGFVVGDAFGAGDLAAAAGDAAGELASEGDPVAPGEGAPGGGEPTFAGGGLGLAPDGATLGAGAPPCGAGEAAGLAAPGGGAGALSSSFGARAPTFARSWPMRIFPKNTGRSKM